MTRAIVAMLLASATALAEPRPPTGATAAVDRVVATIDGKPIWQSEVDEHTFGEHTPEIQRAALDSLIDDTLIIAAARAASIQVTDPEVDAALDEIKKANGLDDAGLDKALTDQHYTRAHYRVELARQLMRLRAVNQLVTPSLTATEPDARRAQLETATVAWIAKLHAAAHIEMRP